MPLLPSAVTSSVVTTAVPRLVAPAPTTTQALTTARAAATARAVARRSIADIDTAAKELERELRALAPGQVVYSDGKTPCPAGPWADDCLVAKDHPADPNHCLLSGGPWVKPLLELPTGCETPGMQLVPLAIGARAQDMLRELLMDRPGATHTLDEKRSWFWTVMRLGSIVGLSTNLSPFWFGQVPNHELYPSPEALAVAEGDRWDTANRAAYEFRWVYGSTRAPEWAPPAEQDWMGIQNGVEPMDRRAVVRPIVTTPYFGAMTSLGWNHGATPAGSLYEQMLKVQSLAYFGGGYGCNAGQAVIRGAGGGTEISNPSEIKQRSGMLPGYGFAFPSAMVAAADPAAFNDKDRAKTQCQRLAGLSPDQQLALIFEATNDAEAHFVHGWYWADINIVGRYWTGFPTPIGAFREQRWERCWAPTAAFFLERAEAFARWWASLPLPQVVQRAVVAYIGDLEGKLVQLTARGIPTAITPSQLRELRDAVAAQSLNEGTSITAAGVAIAGALNGIVGTVLSVVNVLLAGIFSLWQSLNNPANSSEFALVPQPLVMRTPRLDTVCSFSPERAGGIGSLHLDFTDVTRWGAAPLRELAEGRDAPEALRNAANNPCAWLSVVAGLQPKRTNWGPYAAAGIVAVGAAVLWRWLG